MKKPSGIVLWKGKSPVDKGYIAFIATGLNGKSENTKTGNIIQTYIIRRDIEPILARRLGMDKSICGNCKHREHSTCYVNLCHGPLGVFNAFHNGSYKDFEPEDIQYFKDKEIRLGTYGDPCLIPFSIVDMLGSVSDMIFGYTHAYRYCDQRFKRYCMASTDSIVGYLDEYKRAKDMGWRSFRVFADNKGRTVYDVKQENEFICPASKEAGVKTDCKHCKACRGLSSKTTKDVLINLHGDCEELGNWRKKRYIKMMKAIKNKKKYRRDYVSEYKLFKKVCPF